MKKLLKHKKALSPVVAAIILIAVTVAVSIAVAAWMGALTIGFMGGGEELKISSVSFTAGGTGITIKVHNTGTSTIIISECRSVGKTTLTLAPDTDPPNPLKAGESKTITWADFTWKNGEKYDIQVITAKGNVFPTRATAPD